MDFARIISRSTPADRRLEIDEELQAILKANLEILQRPIG
jgi:hypothetical protein